MRSMNYTGKGQRGQSLNHEFCSKIHDSRTDPFDLLTPLRNSRGYVLMAVVAIFTISFFLVTLSMTRSLQEEKRVLLFYRNHQLRNCTESGLEYGLWQLKQTSGRYTGEETFHLDNSIINVKIQNASMVPGKKEIFVSVADIASSNDILKSMISSVFVNNGSPQDYKLESVRTLSTANPALVFRNIVGSDTRTRNASDLWSAESAPLARRPGTQVSREFLRIILGVMLGVLCIWWIVLILKKRRET